MGWVLDSQEVRTMIWWLLALPVYLIGYVVCVAVMTRAGIVEHDVRGCSLIWPLTAIYGMMVLIGLGAVEAIKFVHRTNNKSLYQLGRRLGGRRD